VITAEREKKKRRQKTNLLVSLRHVLPLLRKVLAEVLVKHKEGGAGGGRNLRPVGLGRLGLGRLGDGRRKRLGFGDGGSPDSPGLGGGSLDSSGLGSDSLGSPGLGSDSLDSPGLGGSLGGGLGELPADGSGDLGGEGGSHHRHHGSHGGHRAAQVAQQGAGPHKNIHDQIDEFPNGKKKRKKNHDIMKS